MSHPREYSPELQYLWASVSEIISGTHCEKGHSNISQHKTGGLDHRESTYQHTSEKCTVATHGHR